MINQWKSAFLRLWAVKAVRRTIIAGVIAGSLWGWTCELAPVDASAQVTIAAVSLASGGQPITAMTQISSLATAMSVTASFGPPAFDVDAEFPDFHQETSAMPGSAICTLAMWNVVGIHLVDSAISADVVRAAEGVSLASPRFFPAGHFLYSVTDLSEDTADVLTAPAPQKSLTEHLSIDLGSRSGANLKNYTVYFILVITQSGQVICLLQATPYLKSGSSGGEAGESRWQPPSQRRMRRIGRDPPPTSRFKRALVH